MVDASRSTTQRHWDDVYRKVGATGGSWYQRRPTVSLELIDVLGVERDAPVVDVGGGASHLVDALLDRGFADVSVLDVSERALALARERFGTDGRVHLVHDDLLEWRPARRFGLWHDRAVFHFLVENRDRMRYLERMRSVLSEGGCAVVATFAEDGPPQCSGLPVARYDVDALAATFAPDFQLVESRSEAHRTPSGAEQRFAWVALRRRTDGYEEAPASPPRSAPGT